MDSRYQKYKDAYTKYRDNNRVNANMYRKDKHNLDNFDGKVEAVLERDNYKCTVCGMTNDDHHRVFSRRITIHHIDGNGKSKDVKNNNMDNLQTLCLTCHGKIEMNNRTFCRNGHEYTDENTYLGGTGRLCRICMRSRQNRYRATRRKADEN